MRSVGVRGSLLAGVSAAAILAYAPTPAAAQDVAAQSQEDYYTQRARHTLEVEGRSAPKPHPLAAYYPGMDIVVCEAGCAGGQGAQVVAARKRDEPVVKSEGFMVATSANAASVETSDAASDIACAAGCYTAEDSRPLPRLTPPRVNRLELPPRDRLSPVR